jgi:glutaredoxin
MGQITLFSSEINNYDSRLVKEALEKHNVPYVDISVTNNEQKMRDMVSLSGGSQAPQVFLTNKYIGGVNEVIDLVRGWEKTGSPKYFYKAFVKNDNEPLDSRLQLETFQEKSSSENTFITKTTTPASDDACLRNIKNDLISAMKFIRFMEESVKVKQ